jgi:hypothetical protein
MFGVAGLLVVAAVAAPAAAWAQQTKNAGGIYSCTDARGRKLTSDRPIIECLDREQRVMNKDGSVRTTLPPSFTAEERAAIEEAQKRKQADEAARKDIVRHDRNLLARFRNEDAHSRARQNALGDISAALRLSEKRLVSLEKDRKPLLDEAEFYKGKALPPKLKSQLEYIDVATEAQKTLVQNQQAELARISALYDDELARLRRLWSGAPPGTVGPIPSTAAAPRR